MKLLYFSDPMCSNERMRNPFENVSYADQQAFSESFIEERLQDIGQVIRSTTAAHVQENVHLEDLFSGTTPLQFVFDFLPPTPYFAVGDRAACINYLCNYVLDGIRDAAIQEAHDGPSSCPTSASCDFPEKQADPSKLLGVVTLMFNPPPEEV